MLDDSSLLLKWSVSAQVIAEMLQTSEDELPTSQGMTHHENTPTFKATFKKDKYAFIEVFLEAENPFQKNASFILSINMFWMKMLQILSD